MKIIGIFLVSVLVYGATCKEESAKHSNPTHGSHYKDGEHDDKYDHEAILGSDDEVEEYSHLSPEEAKEKLAKLSVKMDANQDGSIDMQELVKWILHSFQTLNLEDTKEKFMTDDKDQDGFVSWDEFTESTYGMLEEDLKDYQDNADSPDSKKSMAKSLAYDKKKFQAADENGDGKLDLSDASAFLHPYDYIRMADVETDRVLAEYDTNVDGKIDLKEYISSPSFAEREEEDMIGEKENFKFNDADGDGVLNKAEILTWVSPDLDKMASEEANHLMGETDKNKDGQLSLEEIKDEHELWVGSEATDDEDMMADHDEL